MFSILEVFFVARTVLKIKEDILSRDAFRTMVCVKKYFIDIYQTLYTYNLYQRLKFSITLLFFI